MIKWLLKNTAEFRVETLSDVEVLHKQLQQACEYEDYTLTSFSWTEKTIKPGTDLEENYFVVRYVYVFNNAKDPEFPYNGVNFNKAELNTISDLVSNTDTNTEQEEEVW